MLARLLATGTAVYTDIRAAQHRSNKLQHFPKKVKPNPPLVKSLVPVPTLRQPKLEKSGDIRSQQLQALSTDNRAVEVSDGEKKANREFIVSSTALGLIVSSQLLYPPLLLASFPLLLYIATSRIKSAYQKLFVERRFSIVAIDALWFTGAMLSGYYFWAALGGIVYSIGSKLLAKTEDSTRKSLTNILGEQPQTVWVLTNGVEVEIPFEQLQAGEIVVVGAGQVIPVDGTIAQGVASIDQHALTGESQPAEKSVGDSVLASTILLSGKIQIQVEKTGQDTAAAKIGEILLETSNFQLSLQSRGEALTDRAALPTLLLSLVGLPLVGPSGALALLGNYPGANLRLLSPMTLLNFLQMASKHGILVKDGRSLEQVSEIDTIVFDKTGTLTLETPHVGKIHSCHGFSEGALLIYAATAEHKQPHPIARAILQAASERDLPLAEIQDAHYEIGYGIKVKVEEKLIRVGSERFMRMENIDISPEMQVIYDGCRTQGHSLVMVAVDKQLAGAIELHATIRPETKDVVQELRRRNISLYIISGDQEEPTKKLAEELGINNYFANTLPENKAQLVEGLQQEGKTVCFIGDGINDSIALGQADISISLSGASTIATDTAQIVLMDANLNRLLDLLEITSQLDKNMKTSSIISTIPGIIGICGVFSLHFGVVSGSLLYALGLFSGVANTLRPLSNQTQNEAKQLQDSRHQI